VFHCEIDKDVSLIVYHDPNMENGNFIKAIMLDQWMPFKVLHEQIFDLQLSKYKRPELQNKS
jgi:hypothetical protein